MDIGGERENLYVYSPFLCVDFLLFVRKDKQEKQKVEWHSHLMDQQFIIRENRKFYFRKLVYLLI